MINEIRKRNSALLENSKPRNENFIMQMAIKKILEDDNCFFYMNINDAFILLETLGYKGKEIAIVYEELINSESYCKINIDV